jgi:hypothetical protein
MITTESDKRQTKLLLRNMIIQLFNREKKEFADRKHKVEVIPLGPTELQIVYDNGVGAPDRFVVKVSLPRG